MRKIILFFILSSLLFVTRAQVLLNLQLPQVGLQVKNQLWTMALINTSSEVLSVKLDMTLTDVFTGQAVLSGSSNTFILSPGAKQIQTSDLVPIQYNVLNTTYNINTNQDGFLPVGIFNVCFSVLKMNGETFDKIAEDCEAIEVEPASPPFLMLPDDRTEIDQNRPLFVWLPPTPLFLFNKLSYELKLVEINSNQNAADAIQNNFPIINQGYIMNSTFQYPLSLQPLDTAKLYAWQVKALNNATGVSNSEIFTFKLSKQRDSVTRQSNVFVKLKGLSEISFTVCTGTLKYEYINTYNNAIIQLSLTDITTKSNQKLLLANDQQQVAYGQNFLKIDFTGNNTLINNHIYQLEVSGTKGEKQAIKFIYIKED